jgi:phosphoglucomutase
MPEVQIEEAKETENNGLQVSVISNTDLYVEMLKALFDLEQIKTFIEAKNLKILIDGMHGVASPYAVEVFQKVLGLDESSLMRCQSLPDFGKGHPDPNLTYAKGLV